MTQRSKSTLFLIEQLIVIAVFAISAAVCINILTAAFFITENTVAENNALLKAESAAEVFKATGGDVGAVRTILGGTSGERGGYPGVTVYYDSGWQISNEENASFVLHIGYLPSVLIDPLVLAELTVDRITGEEIVAFPLAARTG